MRVAVLAHSFPRFPGDTHGPFVKHLSEALANLGHRVDVLVPFDPEIREDPETPLLIHSFRYFWPDRWHLLGYSRTLKRDVALRSWAWLQSPFYFLFAERALRRLVRRRQIHLVHAHWLLPNGYVASRVARATGVPYAVTLHGSDIFMAERNPLFRHLARRALAGASHVTSCSADLRDRLLALGGAEHADKVLLVPNGTDVEAEPAPSSGDGWRRRLGVTADKVDFPGLLSHPEVLGLIAAAEVFVMPSVRDARGNIDGLPIVVLEAMAAGKPVVATDVAGIPLAVDDGVNGVLVPPRDPAALAAAVTGVLGDPGRAAAMGGAARRKVSAELSWTAVARRHDALYRRVGSAVRT